MQTITLAITGLILVASLKYKASLTKLFIFTYSKFLNLPSGTVKSRIKTVNKAKHSFTKI